MNSRMDNVDTGYQMAQRMEEMNQMMDAMKSGNTSQMAHIFQSAGHGINQSYVEQISADMITGYNHYSLPPYIPPPLPPFPP